MLSSYLPRIFSAFGNTMLFLKLSREDISLFLVRTKFFGEKEKFEYFHELDFYGGNWNRWESRGY